MIGESVWNLPIWAIVGLVTAILMAGHEVGVQIRHKLGGSILKDLAMPRGQEVLLFVNGFGGTPTLELYLVVTAALKVLQGSGIKAVRFLTGSYVTSLEMAGCSISVTAVDAPMLALWDAPVHTAALRWGV